MVDVMNIMLTAVDEYAVKLTASARGSVLADVTEFVPAGDNVGWYVVMGDVLTIDGEHAGVIN
jgi:hypothetical protein